MLLECSNLSNVSNVVCPGWRIQNLQKNIYSQNVPPECSNVSNVRNVVVSKRKHCFPEKLSHCSKNVVMLGMLVLLFVQNEDYTIKMNIIYPQNKVMLVILCFLNQLFEQKCCYHIISSLHTH